MCLANYFKHPKHGECTPCKTGSYIGVVCPHIGTTVEALELREGYWRTGATSTEIYKCAEKDFCLGGNETTKYCRAGHKGPLCSVCVDKYYARTNGYCAKCETSGWQIPVIILCLMLTIMLVVFTCHKFKIYKKFRNKTAKLLQSRGKQIFVFAQIIVTMSVVFGFSEVFPTSYLELLDIISFVALNIPITAGKEFIRQKLKKIMQIVQLLTRPHFARSPNRQRVFHKSHIADVCWVAGDERCATFRHCASPSSAKDDHCKVGRERKKAFLRAGLYTRRGNRLLLAARNIASALFHVLLRALRPSWAAADH